MAAEPVTTSSSNSPRSPVGSSSAPVDPLPPEVDGVVEERAHLGPALRLAPPSLTGRGGAIAAHRDGAELRERLRHDEVVRTGEEPEEVVRMVGEERVGLRSGV